MRNAFGAIAAMTLLCANCGAGADDMADAIRAASERVQRTYTLLHENPELGKQEYKAQAHLKAELQSLGFSQFVESQEAPTAVIAILDSGKPGPVIALRAEMDARKVEPKEPTDHSPRSKIDGVMHNCGHDVHAAILLGTAAILSANRTRFSGKIVFLFQPAEESAGGADDIVREGILPRLGVTRIFAQHVAPGVPVGTIAIAPGYVLAGSNYFNLQIRGRGSHAAAPSDGTDTPLVAARMATALAEYPARHLDIANRPLVISVTKLLADGKENNVIPADAELHGTIRTFEDIETNIDGRGSLKDRLAEFVARMGNEAGVEPILSIRPAAPPTKNDPELFEKVVRPLMQSWPGRVDTQPWRGMFAEDFSYYTRSIPSLYFSLGIARDTLGKSGVHTAQFDIHPDAFTVGLRLMTSLAIIATNGQMDWR